MVERLSARGEDEAINPAYHTCSICGKTFDDLAHAQKHMTVEHMQKGEVPA